MALRRYVYTNIDPAVISAMGASIAGVGFNQFLQLEIANEASIPLVDGYMASCGYIYDDDAGKYLRVRSQPSGTLKSVEVEDDNDIHARDA